MAQYLKIIILLIIVINSVSFADPFGTLLGAYNSVNVYSNGSGGYISNDYNYVNGTNTGMKWQCVEYVNRYYLIIYDKNIRVAGHNAVDYFPNATQHGLVSYPNNGTIPPSIGDVLCFSGGNPNYGHVAIVREIGSNYLKIAQQNVTNNSGDVNYNVNMTVSGGNYNVSGASIGSGYLCQGWLRSSSTPTCSFTVNGLTLPNGWKFWKIPPMPTNFYNVNMIITGLQSGQYWALYVARPSGNIQSVATNQSVSNFSFYFNVDSASSLYPNGGEYFLKLTAQGGSPTWGTSAQFYISNLPTMSVTITPQPLVIGQSAKLKWYVYGGIPSLSYGGLTGRIRFQWYQNNQPKGNLDSTFFTYDSLIFTVPTSIIPGDNYKIGAANSDVGTSAPGGIVSAFTNAFSIINPTSIHQEGTKKPDNNKLFNNYPNPFNPQTKIKFDLSFPGNVKLTVYDVNGKEVATIVDANLQAGSYSISWNASDFSSGVYFYELRSGDYKETKRMVIWK